MIALTPRLDLTWPAGQEGRIDSTFIKIALDAPQWPVGVPEIRIMTSLTVGSIVAGEKDQSIVVHSQLFQNIEQMPNLVVEIFHHRSISSDWVYHIRTGFSGTRSVFAYPLVKLGIHLTPFLMQLFGGMHCRMGYRSRNVAEERFFLFHTLFDKGKCIIHDHIMNIGSFFKRDFLPIPHDAGWVISVGNHLVFPPRKMVKTVG